MNFNKQIDMCAKELRASIANVYFSFCKGKFCKGCILNKKENSEYTFCKLHYLIHELYGEKKEKAMTYYKQIAEMLGVELGEEFRLKSNSSGVLNRVRYKITQEGLMYSVERVKWLRSTLLLSIFSEDFSVVKLPWKPKYNELYWKWGTRSEFADYSHWNDSSSDFLSWKMGNCFKTEEEAKTKGKEIMEAIQKEYEEA